jgi:hypothetical protein
VTRDHFARPLPPDAAVGDLLDSLPRVLAADDLRALVSAIREARARDRLRLLMMGGHVVKCGLGPVITSLLRGRFVNAVAMNGAAAIHDAELALWGKTSEDVAAGLGEGVFGMVEETAELLNGCAVEAARAGRGFGAVLAAEVGKRSPGGNEGSILAACHALGVPLTVHVALGTDIVHQHPSADGGAIGESTFLDFRLLASRLVDLREGGVALNLGSAVLLPEVFLKALAVARNLEGPVEGFVTANFDFLRQYRPLENVVRRPTRESGRGYNFVGHHEIMIPLLAAALESAPR